MKTGFIALLPCVIFLATFSLLSIIYRSPWPLDNNFAIFAAFIALIASIFTFQNHATFNERLEIFIKGSSKSIVAYMCYIFFFSRVFTTILEQTHCIKSITNILLHIIPTTLILPVLFLGSAILSFAGATSLGAIAICMPIAVSISKILILHPSLISATIVCGAIFGENLLMLSHAIRTTKFVAIENLLFNVRIIGIASFASIVMLLYQNNLIANITHLENLPTINFMDIVKTIPFLLTFYLAFTKLDFIVIMVFGMIVTLTIGLYYNDITTIQVINIFFDAFYHSKATVNIFVFILLMSGLSTVIVYNGGIKYLTSKLKSILSENNYGNFYNSCLITCTNFCISLIVADKVSKHRYENHDLTPRAIFHLPGIQAFALQGTLPHIPQLLLAASIAHITIMSIIPYLYYQLFLAAITWLSAISYNHTTIYYDEQV